MNPLKKYTELLKVSHITRITTFCALIAIGSIFGTDGIVEIESLRHVFDTLMWVGLVPLTLYVLLLTFLGVYNITSKTAYKPGDYNKWRDGDFDEWKKKNNIGTGPVDKFIEWFDNPFKK